VTLGLGVSEVASRREWREVVLAPLAAAYSAIDCVLAGMVVRGLGIEAICLYLELTQAAMLERVVALGLPTPHDRPLRKPGGRNPWSLLETRRLISWWLDGIHVDNIGERLSRSPGGVRSKARRLGLPRRDRKALVRLVPLVPASSAPTGSPAAASAVQPASSSDLAPSEQLRLPANVLPPPTSSSAVQARSSSPSARALRDPFEADQKRDRGMHDLLTAPHAAKQKPGEQKWTMGELDELARRAWANQHWKAIARDLNRTLGSVRSQLSRLQLPRHDRTKLVDKYAPDVVEQNIRAAGYVRRICQITKRPFWAHRTTGNRYHSREGMRSREYQDRNGAGAAFF
jgi:hypothetical protein